MSSPSRTPLRSSVLVSATALLAGIAMPFAFSPTEWWWLAPISLVVLYLLVHDQTPRRGAFIAWWYALGYFGVGVSWVYHSILLFGAAVAPLAAGVTALFVLVMTVFPPLAVGLWLRWRPAYAGTLFGSVLSAGLLAALWVITEEVLRGKIMGGFPWILVGYSQTTGPLGGYAPLVGVYGISALVVLVSALLGAVCVHRDRASVTVSIIVLSLLGGGAWWLDNHDWTDARDTTLRVRLVQANIPQELKFSRERLETSLREHVDLSWGSIGKVDLVVWPETAIPTYFDNVENYLSSVVDTFESASVDVLSGGFHRDGDRVYNSIRQLGGTRQLYQKRHLVPFGEYMPFRIVLQWLARYIQIPMSDLARGDGPVQPMQLQGEAIGLSICYEDVYGEEMRHLLPASTVLINVSNDAWFGNTLAPHQHEQKARMRAREFGRPMIRVTNTGVSSGIDHRGTVLGRIAHDQRGFLDLEVTPRTGATPYARTGNWPVVLFAMLIIVLAIGLRRRGQ